MKLGSQNGQLLMFIGFYNPFHRIGSPIKAVSQPADGLMMGGICFKVTAKIMIEDRAFQSDNAMADLGIIVDISQLFHKVLIESTA